MESSPFTDVPNGDGCGDGWHDIPAASPPALLAAINTAPGASASANLPASPLSTAPVTAAGTAAAIGTALSPSTTDPSGAAAPTNYAEPSTHCPTRADTSSGHFLEPQLRGPGRTSMMGQHIPLAPWLPPIPWDSSSRRSLAPLPPDQMDRTQVLKNKKIVGEKQLI